MAMTLHIEDTETHLDHLNEYCLLEIFSQKSLTPMDLCALAETCKLFKRITQRVFPKTLHIHVASSKYYISLKNYGPGFVEIESAHDVERIFKHFGRFVAIDLADATHIMNFVAKHCVVGTLKELRVNRVEITETMAVELKPILQQLQKFTIYHTSILCGANVLANCDSLVELNIIERHGQSCYKAIVENDFPKLRQLSFEAEDCFDSAKMLNFLDRHRDLKCLHLPAHNFKGREDFLCKLGSSCKDLEELQIVSHDQSAATTLDFSKFQSLKSLKLFFRHDEAMIVRLQDATSLEVLEIAGLFDSKELFETLPFLKNLRKLSVNTVFKSETVSWTSLHQLTKLSLYSGFHVIENVVDVIRQLINLGELGIYAGSFLLSEKEFYEIVKLTQGRRKVLTLKCRCQFSQPRWTYKKNGGENLKVKLIKLNRKS